MTDTTALPPQPAPHGYLPGPVVGHNVAPFAGSQMPGVPRPAKGTLDPWWWCPALIALLFIGALWLPGFTLLSFATMATDPCGPDHCPAGITVPLVSAPYLYLAGGVVALLSCAVPWTLRWRKVRFSLAWVGIATSASVIPLLLSVFF